MTEQIDLSNTCYGKVKDIHYTMAILPWGATEPHNYHLPYLTDSILSHAVSVDTAKEVLKKTGKYVMVLPPVNAGSQNPGQHILPFCIHYRYETQKAILSDIISALKRQGINKLLIVNGHGGNSFKNMIRDIYIDHPDFLIATTEWYKIANPKDYFEEDIDDHAAETETSVMLYYDPEKVNLSIMGNGKVNKNFSIEGFNKGIAWTPRHWDKISTDTGVGNPQAATAEKGRRFIEAVVNSLSGLVIEMIAKELYE